MANTIRVPRSVTTNTPPSLAQGELANSEAGSPNGVNELFIGINGAGVFKLLTNTGGNPAEPNSSAQDNQSITSGTGLGGADGGSSGNVTLTLDVSELSVTSMTGSDWIVFDDNGNSRKALVSGINLGAFNNDAGWTTNLGTVTNVSGGTGLLSSGGSTPSISIDYAGTDNFIDSATNLEGSAIALTDTIVYHDDTDNGVKKGLVGDLPFGAGSGDISRVNITAGVGLSGTQDTTTGDHTQTLALDFSELTDMTGAIAGTTEFVINDGGVESRKPASEIELSNFNNDSGWTTNLGTVTSVAGGTGVTSSGGNTPSLSLDFSELSDMTADISGTTQFILQNGSTESRKAASEIELSNFNNDAGWEANDPNEILSTHTSVSGWSFVIDEDAMGSNSNTKVPTQQSVKAYVDNAVTGGLTHKGSYNAATNTPALDTGSPVLAIGDMYTVTVAGTFFDEDLEVGDVIISDVDSSDAAAKADWTMVQRNIGAATETTAGYIELATTGEVSTGTDDTRAITPSKLANCTIDGGTF